MGQVAVFGGGCFWCTEAVFKMLKGVTSVMPGYAGGTKPNPTYEEVCTGRTGHAEVIRIEFDPEKISYRDLLFVFFATHDPTTPDRQGADVGSQYRSIILSANQAQKQEAESFIKEINEAHSFGAPVVTEVKPLEQFYEAENVHHNYYARNPDQPYCQFLIDPKLKKVQKKFKELLKKSCQ